MTGLWTAPDAPAVLADGAARGALRALLLAWADDELVLGHRHAEWTGFAPDIETDVALSSIAQDEIGHARLLYEQVGALDGTTPDRLAFDRSPAAFRCAALVEHENGDWAFTVARAWAYDRADAVRLAALAAAPAGSFAALARTLQREEKYHLWFAETWFDRLAAAGDDSRTRLQAALERVWPDALGLFEPTDGVEHLVRAGVLALDPAGQAAQWTAAAGAHLEAVGLRLPTAAPAAEGGRRGQHTPALAALLDEMTSVWRTDPEARW